MERWEGKLAVVTGASAGIGAAIIRDLARNGVNVVGVARRVERVEEIAMEMMNEKGKVYPMKADVTVESDLVNVFDWIEKELRQPVHIMINNAGLSILRDTIDGRIDEWKRMFETNVYSTGICIREHLKSMNNYGVIDGHIINICSIVGHTILKEFPGFYVYTATKHALKVITEGVRQELIRDKSQTRISSISPGYVATELFDTAADYSHDSANALASFDHLLSEDISNAVMYALSLPQNVRVHELTVKATGEFL